MDVLDAIFSLLVFGFSCFAFGFLLGGIVARSRK